MSLVNAPAISVSVGNIKLGGISSISQPPGVFCNKNAPCWVSGKCYDVVLCNLRENVLNAYARNANAYLENPEGFFEYLDWVFKIIRVFRWHVSGDIPDVRYFGYMCDLHRENPHVTGLCFTKKYNIVNGILKSGEEIPQNLIIIFSGWQGFSPDNPFNLPVSQVIEKQAAEELRGFINLCPNQSDKNWTCEHCFKNRTGCFALKNGEEIYFVRHGVGSVKHREALEKTLRTLGFEKFV